MENIEEKSLKIIRPEFSNFLRDISIIFSDTKSKDKSINLNSSKVINKLFFEKHKDTIWFHNGKLYQVSLDYNFENNTNLKIHEVVPKSPLHEQKTTPSFSYKYSYWLLLIIVAILTSNTIYFSLVFISLFLFLLSDKISNLIYKIKYFILK